MQYSFRRIVLSNGEGEGIDWHMKESHMIIKKVKSMNVHREREY